MVVVVNAVVVVDDIVVDVNVYAIRVFCFFFDVAVVFIDGLCCRCCG